MKSRVTLALASCLAASACLPPAGQGPRPLPDGENGPSAIVRVDYYGGMFNRQVEARFRVDRGAYVMVGHLGGDGQIRVLFPETPQGHGWVAGGKTIRLRPFNARYDVSPHLFSFASARYRSVAAEVNSYDGLGHGYVFVIASRTPLWLDGLSDRSGFKTLEVADYESTVDPRTAVRALANELASGAYTLKFAQNFSGRYARASGCDLSWGQNSFGTLQRWGIYAPWMDLFYSYFTYPGGSLLHGIAWARYQGSALCRGDYHAFGPRFAVWNRGVRVATVPVAPPRPLTPELTRPARRTLTDPGRGILITSRSAMERPTRARNAFGTGRRPSNMRPGGTEGERFGRPSERETIRRPRGSATSARPTETTRITTPRPTRTPTTTTPTKPSGGDTKAQRPPKS